MDLRIFVGGLIISLQSILSLTTAGSTLTCRLCRPGYYASRICSRTYDTVCKPCSTGTFSPVMNTFTNCTPCSNCVDGEFVIEKCSLTSDTKCASCDVTKDRDSPNFRKDCLHQDDSPRISLSDSEGIRLQKSIEANDNSEIYESSSEGSGIGISEPVDVNVPVYPIVNDTDEVDDEKVGLEEGSGEISTVIHLTTPEQNDTTSKPVIITDEEKEITETTTANVTQTTAVRTDDIVIGGTGVVLNNDTATIKPVVIVEDSPEDVSVNVEDAGNSEDNRPQTGASQKKNTDGDTAGASVGVVVTVGLVTAFVFFVLGFLASRVWNGRRERTFNVLEAERRNGKRSVECGSIEYKDKPTSVYDEIPANSKVNGNGAEPKPRSSNQTTGSRPTPIYTKPIKKATAPSSNTAPPKAPTTDSQPTRPVSEIKYMDEGSDDDGETDKLLPPTPPTGNSTNGPVSTPEKAPDAPTPVPSSDANKVEQDPSNEQTPMLPKENSSGES